MKFHIAEREVDGIVVLDLQGQLILGEATDRFTETVSHLIATGKTSLLLNLEKSPNVDSAGLGALILAQTTARNASGVVKLLNVSERHMQLLILTRLSTEFQMFNDETAAVDSFFPDRERKAFDILEFVQSQEQEPELHVGGSDSES
jgi:anti-sigma B factor antagonist